MRAKKKIELIESILERYEEGLCLYCGSTLNGDLEGSEFDGGYSEDWCPNCCKNIDPHDDWEDACLDAIDKIIHDEPFEP